MVLIKLTSPAGSPVWINLACVAIVYRCDKHTDIVLTGTDFRPMVVKPAEQIITMLKWSVRASGFTPTGTSPL